MSDLGKELIEGMKQAVAYAESSEDNEDFEVTEIEVAPADVRGLRENLEMTQQQFASFLGISVHTLSKWERGERSPEGPARVLLKIVEREPEAVLRALHDDSGHRPAAG